MPSVFRKESGGGGSVRLKKRWAGVFSSEARVPDQRRTGPGARAWDSVPEADKEGPGERTPQEPRGPLTESAQHFSSIP